MPYKLRRRGQTLWRGQVRKDGKLVQRQFQTKAEALAWETQVKFGVPLETPQTTPSISLLRWANEYLAFATRFAAKTLNEKRNVFRRLFKAMDHWTAANDLTKKEALIYLQGQYQSRSGYAANKERKNLAAAWKYGQTFIDGFPTVNPFLAVPKFPEERFTRYVPPEKDFWKVLDAAQGQDRVLLQTFLYLAARRGEVYRLTWEDVDFGASRVRLGTRKRVDGSMEHEWLPMAEELFTVLLEHRKQAVNEWVFCHREGRRKGQPFVENRKFPGLLCTQAKVRPFVCHAIRHLTASILAQNNVPMVVIQQVLRHKRLATTERYVRGLEPVRPHLEVLKRTRSVPNEKPAKVAALTG